MFSAFVDMFSDQVKLVQPNGIGGFHSPRTLIGPPSNTPIILNLRTQEALSHSNT